MSRLLPLVLVTLCLAAQLGGQTSGAPSAATFKVKYAAEDSVYIDAGRNAGLAEGMMLTIRRPTVFSAGSGDGQVKARVIVATVQVTSVSNNSAMCSIRSKNFDIRPGDLVVPAVQQEKTPRTLAAAAERPAPQPFAPLPGSLSERTAVNVPAPPNPWKDTPPKIEVIVTQRNAPSQSLPEQMADNDRNRRPAVAANENMPKSLPERMAENERQRRAAGTIPADAPAISTAGNVPQRQPEKPADKSAADPSASPVATAKPQKPVEKNTQAMAAGAAKPSEAASAAKPPEAAAPAKAASQPASPPTALARVSPPASPEKIAPSISPEPPVRGNPAGGRVDQSSTIAAGVNPDSIVPAGPEQPKRQASPGEKNAAGKAPQPPASIVATTKAPEIVTKPPARETIVASAAPPPAMVSANSASAAPRNRTMFRVKYVAEDAVYIDGGTSDGLTEGMALTVRKADTTTVELAVASVSNTSAVCEFRSKGAELQRGDVAQLSQSDQEKLVQAQTLGPNRKYPLVVAFSEGDPLDEEVRESVPKPPLPEVNRARGRIGADYSFIRSTGATTTNTYQVGGVVRMDMTRIGGSHWNLNGYWRGRLNALSSSNQPQSVFDLVNRTYTIGLTYVNPNSHWTVGVGRLYLPWAPSLETTDGGYLGLKLGSHVTLGAFAGTSPDPASFNYNPDRRTGGTFMALEGGSFDGVRFTSTEGVAVSAIEWREDRQFVFSENGLFIKRFLSIYHSAQADIQRLPTGGTTEGLARSFATLRLQPFSRFSIDVNHNYFRDVPTFDPNLVGTGLLDKFLFQGISVGGRLELPGRISLYNNVGQSSKSGDARNSLNQLYGITLARLWKTGLRADVRYSKFVSSFGQGNYRAASLSRSFAEAVRIEVSAGQQRFLSSLATATNYQVLGSTIDLNLGGHYFIESGFNLQRSPQQNFDQWLMTMGYRFDTRKPR